MAMNTYPLKSISNFEKLHSLKEEHCECILTALCFGTGAAPSVLLKVAVLCAVAVLLLLAAGGVCVSALLSAACSGMFFVSGGCHVLPSYSLVLYVIAYTQKHFSLLLGSQNDPKASDTMMNLLDLLENLYRDKD